MVWERVPSILIETAANVSNESRCCWTQGEDRRRAHDVYFSPNRPNRSSTDCSGELAGASFTTNGGGIFQMIFKERQLQVQCFRGRHVRLARRQEGAIFVTQKSVDGDQMIERLPVLGRILHAAGNEDRAR